MKLHGQVHCILERIARWFHCVNPTWVVLFERVTHSQLNLALGRQEMARNHRVAVTPSDFRGRALVGAAPIKVKVNYSRTVSSGS